MAAINAASARSTPAGSSPTKASGTWPGIATSRTADRVFRVDRIRKATLLDTLFDRPTDPPGLQLLDPAAGVPRVVIDVAPPRLGYSISIRTTKANCSTTGGLDCVCPSRHRAWIERLLVRLGPDVRVVDAPEDLGIAGRNAAAARILARYGR